jgi:hypothetical protein
VTRIALLGNCQARGLGRALQYFAPAAEITVVPLWEMAERFPSVDGCVRKLRGFDLVFYNRFVKQAGSDIDSDTIAGGVPGAICYPSITFAAYHPDVVYVVRGPPWTLVQTPMGDYNSALILYGYLQRLSEGETAKFFDAQTYRKLGYLDLWQSSVDELLKLPESEAFDLPGLILAWSRQGCFMHSSVHPKIGPLLDIARRMLQLSGMQVREEEGRTFVRDDLLDSEVWPIYPEIAERYGLPKGGYTFKRKGDDHRWREFMTLDEFIAGSFTCYDAIGRDQLRCQRVEEWIADRSLGPVRP